MNPAVRASPEFPEVATRWGDAINARDTETLRNLLSTAIDALAAADSEGLGDIGRIEVASMMFTDIVGSSALAESPGDAAWSKAVQGHQCIIGGIIAKTGGRLVKCLGDGTLSVFPAAGTAMTTAQEIQRTITDSPTGSRIRLRIGIHTGDVVESGGDYIGNVVNKAARIAARLEWET